MKTVTLFIVVIVLLKISNAQQGYDYNPTATAATNTQIFPIPQGEPVPGFVNNRPSFTAPLPSGGSSFPPPAPVSPAISARPVVNPVSRPVVTGSNVGFPNPAGFGSVPGGRQSTIPRPGQQNFGLQQNNVGVNVLGIQGEGDYSAIPGVAGTDYPVYAEIPRTSFDCANQIWPGFYADIETQCQVFHVCALNKTFDFLCPNGTIFSQEHLVCVWWNMFDCNANTVTEMYANNAGIYDYTQTGPPVQTDANPNAVANNFRRPIGASRPGANSAVNFPASQAQPAFPVSGNAQAQRTPSGAFPAFPSTVVPQGQASSYPIRPGSGAVTFPAAGEQFSAQNPISNYLPPTRQG